MNLSDAREKYEYFSGKASEIVRQLGFAGIAIVWIFKVDLRNGPAMPLSLMLAAMLLVLGLTFDLLHYLYGAIAWGVFHRIKERSEVSEDREFLAPHWINWPTIAFFYAKIATVGGAYIFLILFLSHRIAVTFG